MPRDAIRRAVLALTCYTALALVELGPGPWRGEVVSPAATFVRAGPFANEVRAAAPHGNSVTGDSMLLFEPSRRFAADALARDGRIPLWKDTASCGAPLVGNGQSAVYFPPVALALWLGLPDWTNAVLAVLKLVAGAFGAYLLARRLLGTFAGPLLAGLAFGFGGFEITYLEFPLTNVSALLPWLILATDRAAERPSPRRLALVALICGLQHLGGHPETAFHCQVVAAALGVVRIAATHRGAGWRAAARPTLTLASAYVGGALLGAAQLLPQAEYLWLSDALPRRAELIERFGERTLGIAAPAASAAFAVCCLLAALALRALARARRPLAVPAVVLFAATVAGLVAGLAAGLRWYFTAPLHPDWFGSELHYRGDFNYVEAASLYCGAAVAASLLGLLFGRPRGVMKVAGIGAALGATTGLRAPLFHDALAHVPLFDVAANGRMQLFALLALALLSGGGLDALRTAALPAGAGRRFLAVALALFGAVLVAPAAAVATGTLRAGPAAPPAATGGLSAALVAADPESPERALQGWFAADSAPLDAALWYERSAAVPASIVPVPEAKLSGDERFEGVPRPVYAFRAVLPAGAATDHSSGVRLAVRMRDGTARASNLLVPPELAGLARVPWPAVPARRTSPAPLLFVAAGTALLAAALARRGAASHAAPATFVLLAAASLLQFGAGFQSTLPRELYYPPSPALTALRTLAPAGRFLLARGFGLPPEVPTWYGIPDVRGYDALVPRRTALLLRAAMDQPGAWNDLPALPARPDVDWRLLGLAAVRWLADAAAAPPGFVPVPYPGAERIRPFPIWENPHFLPRARLVAGVEVEPDDARALARLADPTFDPRATALLARGTPRPAADRDAGAASIESARPDRIVVRVAPRAPCMLLLADSHFPGWRARVDGQERPIERANVAFRAVAVGPGDSEVEFAYEPLSSRVGRAASALALLLLGLAAAWRRS